MRSLGVYQTVCLSLQPLIDFQEADAAEDSHNAVAPKDRPMSPKPMVEATSARTPMTINAMPMNFMTCPPYCTLK